MRLNQCDVRSLLVNEILEVLERLQPKGIYFNFQKRQLI